MKKLLYILSILSIVIWSCGNSAEAPTDEQTEEAGAQIEGDAIDLTPHGMAYTIVVPKSDAGDVEAMANDWGGIELRKGEGYMVLLAYGEGDIALLKSDLQGDLLYKSTILDEGENYLVYKREIEGSGMDPEYHFIHIAKFGNDIIEIQNMKDVVFSEEAIKKMHASARTLQPKAGA